MQIPTLIGLLLGLSFAARGVTVSTAQYGNDRTGANTSEPFLTPTTVTGLHKQCSVTVDGHIYAQVLIIDGVNISGATSVGVTVTMHNSVYLFNAATCVQIWTVNLGSPYTDYPETNAFPGNEVGCTSTPVVDTNTNILYVMCPRSSGVWRMYSLNLADGSTYHAPVNTTGSNNGVTFNNAVHLQRSALLLHGGIVVACFASYGDVPPYQGWCFGFDATTLAIIDPWADVSTSNGQAGIWMGGGGPVSDGTDIFLSTGNGDFDGTANFGNSFIRLSSSLTLLDFATPSDWADINAHDRDINSGHVFLTGNYIVGGGKDGRIFVLDKASMGGLQGTGAGPHQLFAAQNGGIFSGTVFANNSLILAALNTTLKRFAWDASSGMFNASPVSVGDGPFPNPGPSLTYTSNGADTSTALIWGVVPAGSAFSSVQAGTLRAWRASSLTEVYSSGSGADALGNFAKFVSPTAANGRVYVPTFSNTVVMYAITTGQSMSITGRTSLAGRVGLGQ